MECGGGARLPAVSARAAQAGLTGIEFGVNIPGTVGGAVRMNANAYDGDLGSVLEWVDVVTVAGTTRRGPDDLGFAYRRSNLSPARSSPGRASTLTRAPVAEVKATLAEMRAWRKAAQPSGIKTFGSTFKNPADPRAEARTAGQLLEAAGCRGLRIGGAGLLREARQLRRELRRGDHRRRDRGDGRGSPAGQGALRDRARARGAAARSRRHPGRMAQRVIAEGLLERFRRPRAPARGAEDAAPTRRPATRPGAGSRGSSRDRRSCSRSSCSCSRSEAAGCGCGTPRSSPSRGSRSPA